ncbi:ribosomal RNA small subunit methyltransferase A [bacterium BMS3Bbin10]|nr:ribosomal RNA small subunit methyltransferase A [bacterium BMS3Bbin10]HDL16388.1 16S rRNA (adenine(1518)-N(6)/adenine(1519)-N(6))-dimethyltransferase RsmA [Hyphomicrobiales bacterium]
MTGTPDGLPPLSEVIRAHGLSARKGLGQNFILDLNLTRRIARAAGPLDAVNIVEIGAGPGGLTRALLLEGAAKVYAVERDERCLPALEEIASHYPGRVEILRGDALEMDLSELAPSPARIVANLPYGASTELLARWLTTEPWPPWYDRMVLMFQREVAERIVSAPGCKAFGRLSVLAQWRTSPRKLLNLPPRAFTPAPKVDSTLVEFVPVPEPEPAGSCAALQQVVATAFGQRRKMLRKSLRSLMQEPEKTLESIGIDPSLRAEALSVSEFCALARIWHANN